MVTDRKFIIFTSHRSGSTWLADVLNHVDHTSVYSELFLPPAKKISKNRPSFQLQSQTQVYLENSIRSYPHYHYSEQRLGRLRPFSVYRYLDELFEQDGSMGFKLMYGQLAAFPEIWPYVMAKGISVVHLVRENFLDIIISHKYREMTRVAHSVAGEREKLPAVQIELDPEATLARMRSLQRNVKWARLLLDFTRVRQIEVIYEKLRQDSANFRSVFGFLGVDVGNAPPTSQLVKLVRADYPELIRNYSELKERLVDSEFSILIEGK